MTFFSSFLGFGFALITNGLISARMEAQRLARLRENLNKEFGRIYQKYKHLLNQSQNSQPIFIDTPIWHSLVSTGDLLMLLRKKDYKNRDYYDRLFPIHDRIHEIEQMGTDEQFNMRRLDKMKELLNEINDLLNNFRS